MVDPNRTMEHLLGLPRNTEAYHVTTFQVVREDKQGNSHLVTVEVLDAGDGEEYPRYMAVARSDNGKAASGSAAESVEAALSILHWYALD